VLYKILGMLAEQHTLNNDNRKKYKKNTMPISYVAPLYFDRRRLTLSNERVRIVK